MTKNSKFFVKNLTSTPEKWHGPLKPQLRSQTQFMPVLNFPAFEIKIGRKGGQATFLDASSHLYKMLCPSARMSVLMSVCLYVRPYVCHPFPFV